MGIGPSTKETTLHAFKDPLLEVIDKDEEVDLLGIVLVGTPDGNEDKLLVGKRTAVLASAMRPDGVIFSCDGWGNSHVDYVNTLEEIEKREIPVAGITFQGVAGSFVVESSHLDAIVDINKSVEGKETCVLGENSLTELDAKKVLAMLKLKMRRWGERNQ